MLASDFEGPRFFRRAAARQVLRRRRRLGRRLTLIDRALAGAEPTRRTLFCPVQREIARLELAELASRCASELLARGFGANHDRLPGECRTSQRRPSLTSVANCRRNSRCDAAAMIGSIRARPSPATSTTSNTWPRSCRTWMSSSPTQFFASIANQNNLRLGEKFNTTIRALPPGDGRSTPHHCRESRERVPFALRRLPYQR